MRLRTKYILYISIIHFIFLAVTIVIYNHNKILFIICEATIILSMFLFISLFKAIFRPFKLLNAGIESISDKDFSMKILPVGQPELDNLIVVFNKMIEQLRLERAIANEKNFFLEKLIEASPQAIIILDKNQNIRTINPSALNLLKPDKNKTGPKTVHEFPDPWNVELLRLNDMDSAVVQLNGINQYKCSKSYFIDRGVKHSFFQLEELTKEIWNAEKKSYEKVIRMMSHEVNNTVGAVNSIIDSSVCHLEQVNNGEYNDFIHALTVASQRNNSLNIFMENFTEIVRLPQPIKQNVDIHEPLFRSLMSIQNSCTKEGVEFINRINTNNFKVSVDSEQMEQVFVNIIKNAVEAINEKGTVIVETFPDKKQISIKNTGEPITFETSQRLFEAFFTTKKTGQGIGLMLIKEILINHKFKFSLKTRKDSVTEFLIEI